MLQPIRRLDQGADGDVVGDRRVTVMDVELRRPLEPHGAGGDDQVADLDVVAQDAARADADEGGMLRDRQDLGDDDLDVVSADAGRDARETPPLVRAGRCSELAVPVLVLDAVEECRDLRRPILVAGQQDVLGDIARASIDVVLALRGWDRNATVRVAAARARARRSRPANANASKLIDARPRRTTATTTGARASLPIAAGSIDESVAPSDWPSPGTPDVVVATAPPGSGMLTTSVEAATTTSTPPAAVRSTVPLTLTRSPD